MANFDMVGRLNEKNELTLSQRIRPTPPDDPCHADQQLGPIKLAVL